MKEKKLSKNNLIILITLALCGIIAILNYTGLFDVRLNLVFEKEYNISEVRNINISSLYYDLEVKKTSGDKIIVKYYGNDSENINAFLTTESNLNIDMVNHRLKHKRSFLKQKVVVLLPKSYIGNLNIKSTEGDIKVFNNYNINANIESIDGDITLNKVSMANIKTDDSDIVINKVRVLVVNSIDSDIVVNDIKDEVYIKALDGDIIINKIELTNNSYIETTKGDITINNVKNGFVDLSETTGDLIIGESYKGMYELKVKTISGDIVIK